MASPLRSDNGPSGRCEEWKRGEDREEKIRERERGGEESGEEKRGDERREEKGGDERKEEKRERR